MGRRRGVGFGTVARAYTKEIFGKKKRRKKSKPLVLPSFGTGPSIRERVRLRSRSRLLIARRLQRKRKSIYADKAILKDLERGESVRF